MSEEPPILSYEADTHLRVDRLAGDLRSRSARGSVIMMVAFTTQLIIGIGGTAVLARLLTPTDFGYIAMVWTFVNFMLSLREFLLTPVIQKEQLTHEQASGVFWINCLASIVVAVLIIAAAPVLARFFDEDRLIGITIAMAIGVLVGMLGMMHTALLRRQMRFGAISFIEVGAVVVGAIGGIAAALLGAGYWSLVIQQVLIWVWQSAVAMYLCRWRPAGVKASAFGQDEGVRAMLRYGHETTASRLLTYISRNTDSVVVGHYLGPTILGLYQKAYQWSMMPFWQVFLPMTTVTFASFSRLQDDPQRYRLYVRTTLLGLFGVCLPALALLAVESDNAIELLMGSQWTEAIPMLRYLSIGSYLSTFSLITIWLYLPEGRTMDQLKWSFFSAPLTMIGVIVGYWHFHSAVGVGIGYAIASLLLIVPGVWYCVRKSPVTAGDFVSASWRAVVASILSAVVLWFVRPHLPQLSLAVARLTLNSAIYGMIYLVLWLMLPGGMTSLRECWSHLQAIRRGGEPA